MEIKRYSTKYIGHYFVKKKTFFIDKLVNNYPNLCLLLA